MRAGSSTPHTGLSGMSERLAASRLHSRFSVPPFACRQRAANGNRFGPTDLIDQNSRLAAGRMLGKLQPKFDPVRNGNRTTGNKPLFGDRIQETYHAGLGVGQRQPRSSRLNDQAVIGIQFVHPRQLCQSFGRLRLDPPQHQSIWRAGMVGFGNQQVSLKFNRVGSRLLSRQDQPAGPTGVVGFDFYGILVAIVGRECAAETTIG